MLGLFAPATTPGGTDVYLDDETGEIVELPAGSPPPGNAQLAPPSVVLPPDVEARRAAGVRQAEAAGAVSAAGLPTAGVDPARLAAEQRMIQQATPAGAPLPTAPVPAAGGAAGVATPPVAPPVPPAAGVAQPTAPSIPAVQAQPATPAGTVTPAYRAMTLTESSGGKDTEHDRITEPTHPYYRHRAAGRSGLMPQMVLALLRDEEDLKPLYDQLIKPLATKDEPVLSEADADIITAAINGSPTLDAALSKRFWQEEVDQVKTDGSPEGDARVYAFHRGGPEGLAAWDKFVSAGEGDTKTNRPGTVRDTITYRRKRKALTEASYPEEVSGAAAPAADGTASPAAPLLGDEPAGFEPLEFRPMTSTPGGAPSTSGARVDYAPRGAVPGGIMGRLENVTAGLAGQAAPNVRAPAPPVEPGTGTAVEPGTIEGEAMLAEAAERGDLPAGTAPVFDDEGPDETAAPVAGAPAAAESPVDALRRQFHEFRAAYAKGPGTKEIDPTRLWKSKSTGNKILSAIALGLGTFGAGMTGGPNAALQIMQQAIADDIEAQRLTAAQQQAAWSASWEVAESMFNELALYAKGDADAASAKAPAFAAMSKLMGAKEAVKQFGDLRKQYETLPWGASIKSLKGHAPWATKASKYEAERGPALAQIIFELSGKQSNEREAARLTAMLPSADTWESSAKGLQKFDAIQKWIDHKYAALRDAATAAYPGRDFESLSPAEKRVLSGESDDDQDDTMMLGDLPGYEEAE